jgi:xanthine/uracil permease
MSVLLKIVAAVFVALAVFLVYAVINAAGSAGGANVPVCIGYVVGACLLGFLAVKLWRRPPKTA